MLPRSWKENWQPLQAVEPGGQADSKIVVRKDGNDGKKYFLKILRQQKDEERRKRMYREVGAYTTLEHSGILKLIETNAHHFADYDYQLCLVTEYVSGKNLYEFVQQNGPLAVNDAINLSLKLLEILIYCHNEECVHRDIKPNNIMLADSRVEKLVLVDFGLSFNRAEDDNLHTELGLEIGNRFLRLPELEIDSTNKRDPRSDIASICGIFLYALTGCQPVSPLDQDSRLPHQRAHIASKLSNLPVDVSALVQIFDRGFQNNINLRWHRGEQLYTAIQRLGAKGNTGVVRKNSEEILKEIMAHASTASMQMSATHRQALDACLKSAQTEFGKMMNHLTSVVTQLQSGYSIDVRNLVGQNTLGAVRVDGKGEVRFHFKVDIVGSELVMNASNGETSIELLRTDVSTPRFDNEYRESLRVFVLEGIQQLLSANG